MQISLEGAAIGIVSLLISLTTGLMAFLSVRLVKSYDNEIKELKDENLARKKENQMLADIINRNSLEREQQYRTIDKQMYDSNKEFNVCFQEIKIQLAKLERNRHA